MSTPNAIARSHHSKTEDGGGARPARARGVGILQSARANCRAKDWFRIGFGLVWAVDAGFKWQSGFRQGFMGMVMEEGKGEPGWMHGWFQFWINLQHPHSTFFAYTVAVVETVVALALIFGFARKSLYIFGALFSITIWGTAEGFGGPYNAESTDVGAAVMYAVVFLGLLALNREAGPSRFSVDYLIEQRVSWWYRIAELGPRAKETTPAQGPALPALHAPAARAEPGENGAIAMPVLSSSGDGGKRR